MPEYRLTIDPRNPGMCFACCGLFEIAELIAPGGEAWFDDNGRQFTISTNAPLPPRDLALLPAHGEPDDATLEPLELRMGDRRLSLDWWLDETHSEKGPLKTWGGQQTPRRVLGELLRLLDFSVSLDVLDRFSVYTKSRFGVDARSAWEAIDAGYSPNDLGQNARTFPWIEVLAVAGLQGFRPARADRFRYRYTAWLTPLPLGPARAACAGGWPGLPGRSYRFEVAIRGQGYKTFLFAEGVDDV
jgi:CRISPR-associated protein Csb3